VFAGVFDVNRRHGAFVVRTFRVVACGANE
jgi:hypothetical protein